MASIDLIRFSVEGQKLDYIQKYYFSTQTIDTLYCNFNFKTDDLGHVYGGWDLPYLWTQFKDKQGNVYIKQVTADNTCSIPYSCLRQRDFRMTLFATDTEDYMVCNKRYTTNEVVFKFKGNANLNYDGGVDPDDPVPTQWQILLDRIDECESTVEGLSQDVSAMQETVDGLSQDVATMGDNIEGLDDRITANANAIDGLSQDITSIHGDLDDLNTDLDAERIARENADSNLQSAINDRYTKTETDALLANEATARENTDTRLEELINNRYTKAETDTLLDGKANVNDIPDVSSFITRNVNNLTNYTLKTSTGSLIDLEINQSTYVITLSLKDIDGNIISTDTIDLPLESVVVSGSFDSANKKIVLTLQNGNTVDIPVGDLVAGLQTEITSQNKLASDLIDDSNSGNKFVTTSEKQSWDNKYDKPSGGIPSTDLADSVLADYVKNTDYMNNQKGGVAKVQPSVYGLGIDGNGFLSSQPITYEQYLVRTNYYNIDKGTLENVITGKGLSPTITLTQAEYDALETKDANTYYYIPEEE